MDANIPGYTVIREIRKGGMATVYLAIQHNLERQVALKIMSPQLVNDSAFAERFLREAKITASMTHHNIVPVYDVGHFQDYHYLSMEYLPSGDLKGRIKDGIESELGLRVIYQMVDALNYVHARSYIHRDIKPENILFRADQTAVLTDFGIAKLVDAAQVDATSNGTLVGSPRYMSPEQAKAEKTDYRTDIYSLGAVIYEILAGKQLYYAESPVAVAIKHINDPVPALPARFYHLQPMLEKMLAKDPADRYQNMLEVARALEQHVAIPAQQKKEMELLAPLQRMAGVRHLQVRQKRQHPAVVPLVVHGLTPLQNQKTLAASALTLIATPQPSQNHQQQYPSPLPTPQNSAPQPAPAPKPLPAIQAPAAQTNNARNGNQNRHTAVAVILSAGSILMFSILANPRQTSVTPFTPAPEPLNHAPYTFNAAFNTESAAPEWTETSRRLLQANAPSSLLTPALAPAPNPESVSTADINAPQSISLATKTPASNSSKQQTIENQGSAFHKDTPADTQLQSESPAPVDRVTELLTQADAALREFRLMQPIHANAYEMFLVVLELDPENQAANDGIRMVVAKYLVLTDIELRKGNSIKAQQYIDRARAVVAWHHLDDRILQQVISGQTRIVTTQLEKVDQALANNNPAKATQLLRQIRALADKHQLNEQIGPQIRDRQAGIDRQRYVAAQENLDRWHSILQDPEALNAESLSQAYSAYMYMLQHYPQDKTVRSANATFTDAFFKVGKKHFKRKDMDTSEQLIAMGLKIDPQDKQLNELKSRWDRRKHGKEYLLDRFY
ncbi:MAG TPA: protein kinase [Dongiaceae bacterium]|nr:protein kinase [Dongiaceae bacterium]